MTPLSASIRSKIFHKYKPRYWPFVCIIAMIVLLIAGTEKVSAATLDAVLEPSGDTYTLTVDSNKLFDISDGISGEVYPGSIRFHNDTNMPVNLNLVQVKEMTDDTWLYRNSYIRIYDGKGVYYDGKLGGASLDVDLPENWDQEIHFDYHYSDPNARTPDNIAMGRSMGCRFTFQVTELSNLSSGWADTGDFTKNIWLIALIAVICIILWTKVREKQKQKRAEAAEAENSNGTNPPDGTAALSEENTVSVKKAKHSPKEIALDIAICLMVIIAAAEIFIRVRFDPHYVESGSMRPEYAIGAFVLVDDKAYEDTDPKVGDVAVYKIGSREVMHRIKEITEDGKYVFKGDNNDSEDFTPVDKSEIVGKTVWHTNLVAPIVRQTKQLDNV